MSSVSSGPLCAAGSARLNTRHNGNTVTMRMTCSWEFGPHGAGNPPPARCYRTGSSGLDALGQLLVEGRQHRRVRRVRAHQPDDVHQVPHAEGALGAHVGRRADVVVAEQLPAERDQRRVLLAHAVQRPVAAHDVDQLRLQARREGLGSLTVQSYCESCARAVTRIASCMSRRPTRASRVACPSP